MIFNRLRSLAVDRHDSAPANDLSRRTFLKAGVAAGGGFVLGFGLPAWLGDATAAGSSTFAPNAFIRIGTDGSVTLTMPHVEMGQGRYTSIPMLIAEELEVDLKQVRLEHAPPNEKLYGNPLLGGLQATGNSNAIRAAWQPLRQAGATARTMLVAAAAKRWKVDPSSCHAERGEVVHKASARRIKYGALVGDATQMPVPDKVTLDRKSTRLNSSHGYISYAVFCLKKKRARYPVESKPLMSDGRESLYLCLGQRSHPDPTRRPGRLCSASRTARGRRKSSTGKREQH